MNALSIQRWTAVLSGILLAACQTTAGTASMQCGAGGALGAYALCKLAGGKDSDCLKLGTVVGVGGAAICYNYASNLEKRRKELAGHENDLDRRIRYVRGLNQDSEQLNEDLGKRVAATTRSTDELVSRIQQKKITQEQLEKERRLRGEEVQAADAQVARGTEALAEVKAYRAKQKPVSPDLDAAIAKQEQLLASAKQQVELLSAQRARV